MKTFVVAITTVVFAVLPLFGGCSVDEFSNKQRKTAAECNKLGGKLIIGKFCDTSGLYDGGYHQEMDAGGTTQPPAPCGKEGDSERCYSGSAATAQQLPCHPGTRECQQGHWTECHDEMTPRDETCNNSDDDCDGMTDEGLNDELGQATCPVEGLKGICQEGVSLCRSGMMLCLQMTFPNAIDTCNGKDDDCDGNVDEHTELACYDDAAEGCSLKATGGFDCRGICVAGFRTCGPDGVYGDCKGFTTPQSAEHCTLAGEAALDENCDGQIDENCACTSGVSCYTGSPPNTQLVAPCHAGTRACSDAMHGTCEGEVIPHAEDCSNPGTDDDCDGMVDDIPFLGASCADVSTNQGACKTGALWKCMGSDQVCADGPSGKPEVCDGHQVDEDCDGLVDEGFSLSDDENNCGTCGNKCGPELTCCGGSCVSTVVSNANCGSCSNDCGSGSCCNGTCKDIQSDKNNCGSCGHACNALMLQLNCSMGSCKL